MKILLVDDDPSLRILASAILQNAGYDVLHAIDGEDALGRISAEVDVVLLDLHMPKLSGSDVLRQLGDRHELLTRIVVMSAATEDELTTVVTSSGARGYLQKPFNGAQLLAVCGSGNTSVAA
ncbi:MAG TPA: response regulator transcription factor [Thermoanaerobaculia bacterium]